MKLHIQILGPPGPKRLRLPTSSEYIAERSLSPSPRLGRPRQSLCTQSPPIHLLMTDSDSHPLKPLAMVSLAFVSAGASTSPYPNHAKPCHETFPRAAYRVQRGRSPPGSRWPPGAKASFSHPDSTGVALMSQSRRMPLGQHLTRTSGNPLSESSTYKYICQST